MMFVGIDPGRKGAIAFLDSKGNASVYDMITEEQFSHRLLPVCYSSCEVAVEQVHAMPGQSCKSNFTFGEQNMLAKLIGMCYNIHPVMVSPQKWKGYYGLKKAPEESTTDFKHRSVLLARELFPKLEDKLFISKDGRAEALLIAKWLRDNSVAQESL